MRCRFRRLICFVFLAVFLIILYQARVSNRGLLISQSPFIKINHENRTYRILSPFFKYDSGGSYLNFAYFNVEQRDRVSHMDYLYDIPVSSQWQASGHIYPIQVAQFGLSHWSRLESNSKNRQNRIYRFEHLQPNKNSQCSSWLTIENRISMSDTFIHFIISSNSTLHFQLLDNNIELIYSTMSKIHLNDSTKTIIPLQDSPRLVNRHIFTDLTKSVKKTIPIKNELTRIRVCGQSHSHIDQLIIGNQTLYDEQAFYSATQWLLNTQDLSTGCWFIHIRRKFDSHYQYRLRMPWCSAMAQGQAASLLVRRYALSNNIEHLLAIRRAVKPLWSSNITRAYFQNRFLWLEEYPLEPPAKGLFVLNGCLYALIGIIDVHSIDPQPYLLELINEVIHSLHHMLPYYIYPRTSNWSMYDLGHLTMESQIKPSSYSYHLVHITLLQCLSHLFQKTNYSTSQFFHSYAQRFQSAIF